MSSRSGGGEELPSSSATAVFVAALHQARLGQVSKSYLPSLLPLSSSSSELHLLHTLLLSHSFFYNQISTALEASSNQTEKNTTSKMISPDQVIEAFKTHATSSLLVPTTSSSPSVSPIPTVIPNQPYFEKVGEAGTKTLWVSCSLLQSAKTS